MSEPITLTPAELEEVTGYKRAKEQKRHFDALGVLCHVRPDGSLSVGRAHWLSPRTIQAQNDASKRVKIVRRAA